MLRSNKATDTKISTFKDCIRLSLHIYLYYTTVVVVFGFVKKEPRITFSSIITVHTWFNEGADYSDYTVVKVGEWKESRDREGRYWQGESPEPVPFCPLQTSSGLAWDRSRKSTVTEWRPTAWVITRINKVSQDHAMNGQKPDQSATRYLLEREAECSVQAVRWSSNKIWHMQWCSSPQQR
jgi:hypothetical protein